MAEAATKTTFPEKQSSAQKRALQNRKKNVQNRSHRSQIHTARLDLNERVEKKENVEKELKSLHSLVDKAQKKGFFHPNKVARLKSRLTKKANVAK